MACVHETSTFPGFTAMCNELCYAPKHASSRWLVVRTLHPHRSHHHHPRISGWGNRMSGFELAWPGSAFEELLSSAREGALQPLCIIVWEYLGTKRALGTSSRDSALFASESALAARLLHLYVSSHIRDQQTHTVELACTYIPQQASYLSNRDRLQSCLHRCSHANRFATHLTLTLRSFSHNKQSTP